MQKYAVNQQLIETPLAWFNSGEIALRGDIHHLLPKDYLKKNGLDRGRYNQIANYVYRQSEINIRVGNKAPRDYFDTILLQMQDSTQQISCLATQQHLLDNLRMNCVPAEMMEMDIDNYPGFLVQRRRLMAAKMKEYYYTL